MSKVCEALTDVSQSLGEVREGMCGSEYGCSYRPPEGLLRPRQLVAVKEGSDSLTFITGINSGPERIVEMR
jgi:hypothetical protein